MLTPNTPLMLEGKPIEWWADKFKTLIGTTTSTSTSTTTTTDGAPTDVQYVVMTLDANLSAERKLTAGDGLDLTDGGANGNATLAVDILGIEDLSDPGADRIFFWDDSESKADWLVPNNYLSISGLNLNVDVGSIGLDDLANTTLSDPGADRILFWDDSDGKFEYLVANTGLEISGNNLNCTVSGGGAPTDVQYVVMALSGDLSAERALTAGDGLDLTDGGANGNATLAVDVTDFIDTNYGLTESSNNIRVNLEADEGLEFNAGAIRVDVTDFIDTNYGLTENSNNIRINLEASGGLEFNAGALRVDEDESFTWTGTHHFDSDIELDANLDFQGAYSITTTSGDLTIVPTGDVILNPTGDQVIIGDADPLNEVTLQSANYASQTTGWALTYSGGADFRYLFVDEMHAKSFIADLEQALAGGQIICKSVTKLAEGVTFTVPLDGIAIASAVHNGTDYFTVTGDYDNKFDGKTFVVRGSDNNDGTYVCSSDSESGGTTYIFVAGYEITASGASGTICQSLPLVVEDLPSCPGMAVFEANDWVGIKTMTRAGGSMTIKWVYGQVTGYSDNGDGTQTWQFTRAAGDSPDFSEEDEIDVGEGSLVLDFGQEDDCDGFYEVNAIDGNYGENSPYAQIVTWDTHPSSQTVRVRLGNLKGITASLEYGLWAGTDAVENDSQYLLLSDDNFEIHNIPLEIHNGTNAVITLDPDVGGDPAPYPWFGLAADTSSMNFTTTDGIWMGSDSGTWKFRVGDVNGEMLAWDGSDLYVYADANNYLKVTGSDLEFYANSTRTLFLDGSEGDAIFGEVGDSKFNLMWDSSAGDLLIRENTTNIFQFDGSEGNMIIGKVATDSANMFWDGSAGTLSFRGGTDGTDVGVAINTDGALTAGGGNVMLDSSGITIAGQYLEFKSGATSVASFYASGTTTMFLGGQSGLSFILDDSTSKLVARGGIDVGLGGNSPGRGELFTENDVRVGGGLYVGAITNPDADDIWLDGDIRGAGGAWFGATVATDDPAAGDVHYSGTLYSEQTAQHAVYGFHPLTTPATSASWNNVSVDSGDNGTIDLSSVFSLPAEIKAVAVRMAAEDETVGVSCYVGPAVNQEAVQIITQVMNEYICNSGVVPCTDGDIYFYTSGELDDFYLEIFGYWI